MILWSLGCAPVATLYPTSPCRLTAEFAAVSADFSCASAGSTIEARFEGERPLRAGGRRGAGWEGLSFFATVATVDDALLSLGWRPGAVGVAGAREVVAVAAGFLPAGTDVDAPPWAELVDGAATCDARTGSGEVALTGLPEGWTADGAWHLSFADGAGEEDAVETAWSPEWPADCPLSPRAWATVRVAARCDGALVAEAQFLAPDAYTLGLDELGSVATADVAWGASFSARCGESIVQLAEASLAGDAGRLAFSSPILTASRAPDADWRVDSTTCGACATEWEIEVEGLPDL